MSYQHPEDERETSSVWPYVLYGLSLGIIVLALIL